ncbi:MAG: hypothetical protein JWO86_9131 [Myxococcaceae bacterium]|nr:hypothetical protein [Myxococcaceae bacterium]MEA2753405.1 hypothetical protein [Myxococcales bacterium]
MRLGDRNERARPRLASRWIASLVVSAALTASTTSIARADDATPSAEQLFQDARALVEKGDYAAACPKLEASQKLDPAVGTQFNLADCYEHIGRTATAFALFEEVARIARAAGKFERERSAKERVAALAPKLARVHLDVQATAPGLEIRIDEVLLPKTAWSEPFPIDPGAHRVAASAPSHASWESTVTAQESKLAELSVPELVDTTVREAPAPVTAPPSPTQKRLALVAGGIGLVGVAVGAVSGIVALSKRSSAQGECPSETYAFRCPTESGTSAWNAATTAGNVSTVSFIAGGVFLAGTAVLWFTAPSSRTRVGTSLSGVRVEGSF